MEKNTAKLKINLFYKGKILKSYKSFLDLDDIHDFLIFFKKMQKFDQNEIRNKNFQSIFLEDKNIKDRWKTQCEPEDEMVAPSFTEVQVIPHQKYIRIIWILDRGCDGNGSPYPIENLVYLYRPKEGDETEDVVMSVGGSNQSTGAGALETATDQLIPNTVYKNWYLTTIFPTYDEENPITYTIDHFRTLPVLINFSKFEKIESIVDSKKVEISYKIVLGNDSHGSPYQLSDDVVLYDSDGNECGRDESGKLSGTFKIEDLAANNYSNWRLETKTTDPKGKERKMIGDVPEFKIIEVIDPYFNHIKVETDKNSVEVSYQLNLGSDYNGKPYEVIGDIMLYSPRKGIDKLEGKSSELNGTITVNNLNPNTNYYDWYLKVATSAEHTITKENVKTFKTDSLEIIEPKFEIVKVIPKYNDVRIHYKINLGKDQNGNKFILYGPVNLFWTNNDGKKEILTFSERGILGSIFIDGLLVGSVQSSSKNQWFLEAFTNFSSEKNISYSIEEFKMESVLAPEFSIVTPVVQDNSVTIEYRIFLGVDGEGNPYECKSSIYLYDQNDCLRGTNDKCFSDEIVVSDLESQIYQKWYLKVFTNYSEYGDGTLTPTISNPIDFEIKKS